MDSAQQLNSALNMMMSNMSGLKEKLHCNYAFIVRAGKYRPQRVKLVGVLPSSLISIVALSLSISTTNAEEVSSLVERRDQQVAFLNEMISEVERYTDLAAEKRTGALRDIFVDWQEEVLKAKFEDLRSARIAGQAILRPEMLRNLRPHPLLLVVYEGYELGRSIGEIQLAMKEAAIFDAQIEADLKRISRVNRQITELDLAISEHYRNQALAQQTLAVQESTAIGMPTSEFGSDFVSTPITLGPEAVYHTRMACSVAAGVDPSAFGCPAWSQVSMPSSDGGSLCVCHGVPVTSPSSTSKNSLDELAELKAGPLGMTDELSAEIVNFCDQNPSALTCLPASDAIRFGAYCEGPNPLPNCESPFTIGRLGGFCEGPNPLSDCLSNKNGN